MGRPAKKTDQKYCKFCNAEMARKRRPNGDLEDFGSFVRRVYCDQNCMAKGMVKERCSGKSYSRMKAHLNVKESCEQCGKTGHLHVHHKDEDHSNNDIPNLITLCPQCHSKWHSPNYMDGSVTRKPCKLCAKPSARKGLCNSHLSRLKRYGSPLAVKIKTGSGWVLDTSGLPVRSRHSQ